jgi:hypothetical protein
MDLTKIPKTFLWGAIAIFVAVILFYLYLSIQYKIFKPYQEFLDASCKVSSNSAVVIISAKKEIKNIQIVDFGGNGACSIKFIGRGSMDGCELNVTEVAGQYLVKISFEAGNETYKAVIPCESIKRKSILDFLRR